MQLTGQKPKKTIPHSGQCVIEIPPELKTINLDDENESDPTIVEELEKIVRNARKSIGTKKETFTKSAGLTACHAIAALWSITHIPSNLDSERNLMNLDLSVINSILTLYNLYSTTILYKEMQDYKNLFDKEKDDVKLSKKFLKKDAVDKITHARLLQGGAYASVVAALYSTIRYVHNPNPNLYNGAMVALSFVTGGICARMLYQQDRRITKDKDIEESHTNEILTQTQKGLIPSGCGIM